MAIGAGAAGAWVTPSTTTTLTVTLPAHSAGDMLIVIAACKAASITVINPTIGTAGWNKITSSADGTTNSVNGGGSVHQAIFYKVAASGSETNPVVTWGGGQASTPGIAVALGFTKGGDDTWATPVVVQAQTTNATSISVTMGSNPGIAAGDWGIVTHTINDDRVLTVPSWSATGLTLATAVEYPATAQATTSSNDMGGDAGYRVVTVGTASAAPVVTGTQSVAGTGMTGFIRLRVTAAVPSELPPRKTQMNQLLAQ